MWEGEVHLIALFGAVYISTKPSPNTPVKAAPLLLTHFKTSYKIILCVI